MTKTQLQTFNSWTEYLNALREEEITHNPGEYRKVIYNSSYADESQIIEGEITSSSDTLGKAFRIDGKLVEGWHVESNGREIGRVEKIEVLV